MAVLERSRGLRNALKGCGTNDQDLRGSVRGVELWLWDDPGVGTALEGSEGLGGGLGGSGEGSRAWEGFWRGLGGFGRSLGRSASLACPTTLARSVEMWEVRAAVWVWLLCLERFGGFGAGLVALGPCRGCGTVGVRADVLGLAVLERSRR